MFTGLIEEIGTLINRQRQGKLQRIRIQAHTVLTQITIGDSIATNGVCLTVTAHDQTTFTAELMPETSQKTLFTHYRCGMKLNLERALSANGRFGGHMVSGHIDTTAVLNTVLNLGESYQLYFTLSSAHQGLIIPKGSIAINGISLTVIDVTTQGFSVGIIPHTFQHSTLHLLKRNDQVHIEYDLQGKYIQQQIIHSHQSRTAQPSLTLTQLAQWGY